MNETNQLPIRESRVPLFDDRAVEEIIDRIDRVGHVVSIHYEFNATDGLRLDIEREGAAYFSNPRTAMAYLDAFLLGYDFGFGDGRRE